MWHELVVPLVKRPPALQVAALCYRMTGKSCEILLITSTSGRWIVPKGWPIDGLMGHQTALQEAWEEAGVRKGEVNKKSIGAYHSVKTMDNGVEVPCRTLVYPVKVKAVADDYPEDDRRKRQWVSLKKASTLVAEPGLSEIIAQFEDTASRT